MDIPDASPSRSVIRPTHSIFVTHLSLLEASSSVCGPGLGCPSTAHHRHRPSISDMPHAKLALFGTFASYARGLCCALACPRLIVALNLTSGGSIASCDAPAIALASLGTRWRPMPLLAFRVIALGHPSKRGNQRATPRLTCQPGEARTRALPYIAGAVPPSGSSGAPSYISSSLLTCSRALRRRPGRKFCEPTASATKCSGSGS